MKKVEFQAKRPSVHESTNLDAWVQGQAPSDREPTKRLTIDVSLSLHKRIKSGCAIEGLVMADEIRDLLERRWPQNTGEGARS
jgi:hypothetical protein